jgi:hypothetical protein
LLPAKIILMQAHNCAMIVRKIVSEGLFRDAILFMLNSYFWLRPFLAAVFGVVLLSAPATAARDGSTDRPGLDYKTIELSAPDPDLCENACKKDGRCRAWTYSWPGAKGPKAMCSLKTGVPPKRSDTCCISGVLSTSSPVTRTDDPAPAPTKKPVVTAKPAPAPAPQPVPKKPVEAAKPLTEKPADRVIVQPVPAPLPPVEDQETVTVTPTPKPKLRPLQDDETEPREEDEPRRQVPPDPAKVAACNDYASRALAQNSENNQLNCGLSGSLWGFGQSAYFNFCMRNPSSVYNGARAARDRGLDTCKRGVASRDVDREEPVVPDLQDAEPDDLIVDNTRSARFCRNFAGQSIRQARQARRYRCGFGGERWSRSRVRQAQLCRRIGPRAATQLLSTRNRQIQNCRAAGLDGGARRSRCRKYARSAVEQARKARRFDCGYSGRRWSRNYERHLRWCVSVSDRKVRRENRRRERLLDQCR